MATKIPKLSDKQKEILIWILKMSAIGVRQWMNMPEDQDLRVGAGCAPQLGEGCTVWVGWYFGHGEFVDEPTHRGYRIIPKSGHRLALSRSLKRLRDRGLVLKRECQKGPDYTRTVRLSDAGRDIAVALAEAKWGKDWLADLCRKYKVPVHYEADFERQPHYAKSVVSGHYEVTGLYDVTFTPVNNNNQKPEMLTVTDDQIETWAEGYLDQFKKMLIEHATKARDEGDDGSKFMVELEVKMAEIVEASLPEAEREPKRPPTADEESRARALEADARIQGMLGG